LRSVRHGH